MEKINDISQLNGLLTSFFRRGILTNNYMMIDSYKKYIKNGELFFQKSEDEMIIFRDCKNHWRVYYYLTDFKSKFILPDDKPLAIEIVFKKDDENNRQLIRYWESLGFEAYMFRSRMTSDVKDIIIDHSEKSSGSFAKAKHTLEVHQLISDSFDEYLGCIPSLTELEEMIENNEVICIENEHGKIEALLHIGKSRKTNFIWHLLVDSSVRNSGNAKKMLAFFKDRFLKEDKSKLQLWVQDDNLPARGLYESIGLNYDGWKSIGLKR